MPKLRTKKILPPEKDILAFPDHYVNLPGKIAYATLKSMAVADADFENLKTLKKGTVVNLADDGTITAATAASSTAKGTGNAIVFNTIKLDDYDADTDPFINVAVLVHGFVRKDRLVNGEALGANEMIHVVKA